MNWTAAAPILIGAHIASAIEFAAEDAPLVN
jgi:hypothetical protein